MVHTHTINGDCSWYDLNFKKKIQDGGRLKLEDDGDGGGESDDCRGYDKHGDKDKGEDCHDNDEHGDKDEVDNCPDGEYYEIEKSGNDDDDEYNWELLHLPVDMKAKEDYLPWASQGEQSHGAIIDVSVAFYDV